MAYDIRPAQIRALSEIARRGSFSRAAEALRLSQPAISLQIGQLEQACGTPLLERAGKRVSPTEAGRQLLARAEPALAEIEAAVEGLRQRRGDMAGRVRLGAGPTAATYRLPAVLGRLRATHPALDIFLTTGHPADLAAAVLDNDLDAALVALPVARRALAIRPVLAEPLVGIAAPGRLGRVVGPEQLAEHPLILFDRRNNIRQTVEAWFRAAGMAPQVVMELGNVEAIKKLVAADVGVSIVPAVAVQGEAQRSELSQIALRPALTRQLAVIHRRDKVIAPPLAAVLVVLTSAKHLAPAG